MDNLMKEIDRILSIFLRFQSEKQNARPDK